MYVSKQTEGNSSGNKEALMQTIIQAGRVATAYSHSETMFNFITCINNMYFSLCHRGLISAKTVGTLSHV